MKHWCFSFFFFLVFHLYILLIQIKNIQTFSALIKGVNALMILLVAKMPFIFSVFDKLNLSPMCY